MGLDTPSDNADWAAEEGFQYELWTDDQSTLGVTYGALSDTADPTVKRITVVLDAEGDLAIEYLSDISVGTHPEQVLQDCEIYFGG